MHDVEEYYGARISDPMTYLAVSMDVMARWTFPMVPDLMDAEEGEGYVHCRKSIYKGGGIRLEKGSVLEDSVVVGRGCVVGEGSAVSKSCVGENVKIGRGASVKNSIVFGDVTLGDGVRVEGCLLGKGVSVGGGTVVGERCVLGDSVSVDAGKTVPAGTKLVRQLDDDGFGEGEEGEAANSNTGSEYGQFAIPFVEEEDDDSDSDVGERKVEGGDAVGWGRVLGPEQMEDGGESESSDSEGSDFSDFGDQTDIIDDEDAKMSVFHREVLESMQRGFAEGINADNLSLEINSSRHAYAATAQQGRHSVIQFCTGLPALT